MENTVENSEGQRIKHAFSKKLVCINYPGCVENVDKMVETLGGLNEIENNISNRRRPLELRFRPGDGYCKPTISDVEKKPGVLIKLTPKEPSDTPNEQQKFDYEVLGITALTYSFSKLCDFQYLPLVATEDENSESPLTYVYNQIVPDKIPDNDWLVNNELHDMPYFIPPAIFSRFDNPQNRLFFDRSKFYEGRFKPEYAEMLRQQEMDRKNSTSIDQKVIAKKSGHGGIFASFHDTNIPSVPPVLAMQFLNLRHTNKGSYEKIKSVFEERPIWSRAAILYNCQVPKEQLKFILPAVAYHFHNGPWRILWARYGYDPRKDPSSRIYQTFDFRVRATAGLKSNVKAKRQYKSQRYRPRSPVNIRKMSLNQVVETAEEDISVGESSFILKPGMIPPARQMFYQYCDIQLPEIQSMLSRLPPVMPGTKCDYRNGWLPNKFSEQCREIANKYIIEHVQKMIQEENTCRSEPGAQEAIPGTSRSGAMDQKSHDFLEISDSSGNSSGSEYIATDSSDEDYEDVATSSKKVKRKSKKKVNANEEDYNDDNEEVDLDAVKDVNKLLKEKYASLKDFDQLVYDSD